MVTFTSSFRGKGPVSSYACETRFVQEGSLLDHSPKKKKTLPRHTTLTVAGLVRLPVVRVLFVRSMVTVHHVVGTSHLWQGSGAAY